MLADYGGQKCHQTYCGPSIVHFKVEKYQFNKVAGVFDTQSNGRLNNMPVSFTKIIKIQSRVAKRKVACPAFIDSAAACPKPV